MCSFRYFVTSVTISINLVLFLYIFFSYKTKNPAYCGIRPLHQELPRFQSILSSLSNYDLSNHINYRNSLHLSIEIHLYFAKSLIHSQHGYLP